MKVDDEFIPHIGRDKELKLLRRLPTKILCKLAIKWFNKFGIRNNATKFKQLSYKDFVNILEQWLLENLNRTKIAMKILHKFWPFGLNIYQISQINYFIMLEHPLHFKWNSKTIIRTDNNQPYQALLINMNALIDKLYSILAKQYITHIFHKHHNTLPIQLLRIQFFDHSQKLSKDISQINYISRSPFYVAIMDDTTTPIIIHSPDTDAFANYILQTLKNCLPTPIPLLLKSNEVEPIKSLERALITAGTSRLSESMGQWSSYAHDKVDIKPFDNVYDHSSVKGKTIITNDPVKLNWDECMQKFKGELDYLDEFQSVIPVEKVSFNMINSVNDTISKATVEDIIGGQHVSENDQIDTDSDESITIRFKFQGKDVFGGLHKLCSENKIDIDKVPGWLSGENGPHSGTIQNGDFKRRTYDKKNNGGLI